MQMKLAWGETRTLKRSWERKIVQPLRNTVRRFLKKLNVEQFHTWACAQRPRAWSLEEIRTFAFVAALFTVADRWGQCQCPWTDEWVNRTGSTHTAEYYTAPKRKEMRTRAA